MTNLLSKRPDPAEGNSRSRSCPGAPRSVELLAHLLSVQQRGLPGAQSRPPRSRPQPAAPQVSVNAPPTPAKRAGQLLGPHNPAAKPQAPSRLAVDPLGFSMVDPLT